MVRKSPETVPVAALPDFLQIHPLGALVAASLEEQARQIAGGGDEPDPRNPLANAQAGVLTHAASQVRSFLRAAHEGRFDRSAPAAKSTSTTGETYQ